MCWSDTVDPVSGTCTRCFLKIRLPNADIEVRGDVAKEVESVMQSAVKEVLDGKGRQSFAKPGPVFRLFLSYRRADSRAIAGRIYDRLVHEYGKDNVFMDVDTIPPGVDFRKHIRTAIIGCHALIAVIGPRWLGGTEARGGLDNPRDFVRVELELALERDIPIVPVLVDGATMPTPDGLPASIRDLVFRNASQVDSGRDFHPHIDRLITELGGLLEADKT